MLLHNPTSQAELIEDINKMGEIEGDSSPVAIALAFSWNLKNFDYISDIVCQRLSGLYLFQICQMKKPDLARFISRCPNLKSLMLTGMDDIGPDFIAQVFSNGMLPKLEFLESEGSDDAIAAMASAPDLRKIFFRYTDLSITNDGFKRLVEAGGGKKLVEISVSKRSIMA